MLCKDTALVQTDWFTNSISGMQQNVMACQRALAGALICSIVAVLLLNKQPSLYPKPTSVM